jgi:hypothetical protein
MNVFRRIALSAGVAASVTAALTVVSVGAAGGFGSGAGRFTYSDTSANANFYNPDDNSSVSVSADHSLFMVRPRGGVGATAQEMTILSIFVYLPDPDPTQPPLVDMAGCFVIPDSDLVVSKSLNTATLNATVNASDLCEGFIAPIGAGPAKGDGGGGGSGFTFPLTVTGTWSGTGVTLMQSDQGVLKCGSFVATTDSQTNSQFSSSVTVSISGIGTFSGGPSTFGNVSVGTNALNVAGTGILPSACGGKG